MIQRIQTVYLLVVAILMVVMMSVPVGSFYTDKNICEMTNLSYLLPDGAVNYTPWALFAILVVVAVMALVTIFLYRKRMLQIRLTIFNTIVLIGYYLVLAYFVVNPDKAFDDYSFMPSWTVCLPLVSIILNWLAIRAIGFAIKKPSGRFFTSEETPRWLLLFSFVIPEYTFQKEWFASVELFPRLFLR